MRHFEFRQRLMSKCEVTLNGFKTFIIIVVCCQILKIFDVSFGIKKIL